MNDKATQTTMGLYCLNEDSTSEITTLKMPSVFDGDVPILTFSVDKGRSNVVCGKLWGKGGVLSFDGNAEESAKVFFDRVIQLNRDYIMRSNAEPEINCQKNMGERCMKRLDDAVTAVVKRWWSPDWTSAQGRIHTGELIKELQSAMDEFKAMQAQKQDTAIKKTRDEG